MTARNTLAKSVFAAWVSVITQLRSRLSLGIAPRLATSFIAVAVLAAAANIIVEREVWIVHTTEVQRGAVPIATTALRSPVPQSAAEPPPETIPSPLQASLERLDRAVQSRAEANTAETNARYHKVATELDRAVTDYVATAAKAGDALPAKLVPTVRSYQQRGEDIIRLADARRTLLTGYSMHFESFDGRVKQSFDQAWKILGRVVARQSLVQLARDLDELRARYATLSSTEAVDSSALEALAASEAALAQTLAKNRAGFARVDGEAWYAQSSDDLEAMSAARTELLRIDEQHRAIARRFADDATSITAIVARIGTAARADKMQIEPQPPATSATSALAGPRALELKETVSPAPVIASERRVTTTTSTPENHNRRTLVAWISGGVLLLLIYVSFGTILSIVRPVRRMLNATAKLARGETEVRVPRGGIRELDTLAVAFNEMAEQLSAAQQAARQQQHLLEAKVAERTRQLQELAEHDPLTRLANRRQLFSLLNAAIDAAAAQNRYVGVFFLDIDNFKNMNDSMGHAFGDHVLRAIAGRLAESARAFGFAARLGGDEFTVVYESAATIEDICNAGVGLVQAFQHPLSLDGRELIVSVSVGASVFPDHEKNAEALLRAADAALFRAKALGRSQLAVFTPELLEAAAVKFSTEQRLRRAIERGEFELVFQPEVSLETLETVLVEALIRWRLPDGRYALPGEFLAVAEESGLIMEVSDWVLRAAIEAAARWHHGEWPAARVAINVSSRQLFDSSFVERVQVLLQEFKLPPRCIEIELTETVLQTGPTTIDALRRLRAHGVAIALDDFGTGFSSLASLEQLPLTRIKLDRSLIASIDTSARSAAIARAIIGLCHSLGLEITAEGIERPEQLAHLLGNRAIYAQGYLLSYPVSCHELLPVLANMPTVARALLLSSLPGVPESQVAEVLPFAS